MMVPTLIVTPKYPEHNCYGMCARVRKVIPEAESPEGTELIVVEIKNKNGLTIAVLTEASELWMPA